MKQFIEEQLLTLEISAIGVSGAASTAYRIVDEGKFLMTMRCSKCNHPSPQIVMRGNITDGLGIPIYILRCTGKVFEKRQIPVKDKKGKPVTKKVDTEGNDWTEKSVGRPTEIPVMEEKEDWYDCNHPMNVRKPHITDAMAKRLTAEYTIKKEAQLKLQKEQEQEREKKRIQIRKEAEIGSANKTI